MTDYTTTIGGRLRTARLGAGLSQSELHELSGIPKARISRYEHNHVEPSIRSLLRLCAGIGVYAGEIIDPDGAAKERVRAELRTAIARARDRAEVAS